VVLDVGARHNHVPDGGLALHLPALNKQHMKIKECLRSSLSSM
jgi:hypothetical protein